MLLCLLFWGYCALEMLVNLLARKRLESVVLAVACLAPVYLSGLMLGWIKRPSSVPAFVGGLIVVGALGTLRLLQIAGATNWERWKEARSNLRQLFQWVSRP